MKPTEQQKIIIDYNGNSVVVAAPGSGKTFVISQKIKRNLHNLKEHEGVIAISYTNKASTELKNRCLSNGENPKSSFFGTIDKFNLSEVLIPFGKLLFGIPSTDIKIIKKDSLENFENESLDWIDRNLLLTDLDKEKLNILVNYFLNGIILIETIGLFSNYVLDQSIACQNYIKAKYKFMYIDEYQDSGQHQHDIFLKIKNLGANAIAVGDLNQSIYAFSGKDAKFLKELSENDTFEQFILDKNHRCHPSIINYSNYLLNDKAVMIPNVESRVYHFETEGDESSIANFLDKNLIRLKKYFDIKHNNQIALLVRGKSTAKILVNSLKTPNRYFISNDLDSNLNIWSLIFSNLLHYVFNISHKFIDIIEVFTSYDKLLKREIEELKKVKKNIDYIIASGNIDITKLKEQFIDIANIIAPKLSNDESINLLDSVLNNKEELDSYRSAGSEELVIMTLHKSKGLEFDLIIHLDLYEWVLPAKRPGKNNDFDNPIYPNYTQDLNLHYVGITRAIKGCILFTSTRRTNAIGETRSGRHSEFLTLEGIQKLRYIDPKT
ncbi:UvrD-helicase domain-containing protein [Chryseobacterium timonianum]|uniref:UvrD-helicase domain-containing protein n=1 Tax=Chryseobacterium timonianum TaxID=1805473 RepID=UPI00083A99EB|nr:ATP-dependent helicase [Chryseobacterium timonianum]